MHSKSIKFVVIALVLVLVAGSVPAATVMAQDCVPIVVAVWSSPEHDNLVKTAAVYTEETGCEVIIEEIAREAYYDKLTTTILAGSSDYDVMYASSDWLPEWIQAEGLQPLNPYFEDPELVADYFSLDALSPTVDTLTFDGQVYGFPSEGDTAWLFYRKDLLEEAGLEVPQTWDEFLAAALALNNPPERYGTVIGARTDEAVWDFQHYLFGFGGAILDENYNVVVNDDTGVAALEFYAGLLNEYGVVPPDVVTYGYNEILTTLQEDKAAMGIEWMAATQTLQDCEQSPKVCIDGEPQLQYTLVPGVRQDDGTVQRGQGASQWAWIIPSAANNKVDGYKFIEWLTSKEGAVLWALNGGIPSNSDALSDPEVVAQIPQFALLAKAMPYRHLFPITTVSPIMITAFNDAVNASVAGVIAPKDALDEAAAKMEEALRDAGYIE
jgi:multiple sugar transport system substrate-binding protein